MTDEPITFPEQELSITFMAHNLPPMLVISKDGFYVRGVRLEQDANEARAVFDAMTAWLKEYGK